LVAIDEDLAPEWAANEPTMLLSFDSIVQFLKNRVRDITSASLADGENVDEHLLTRTELIEEKCTVSALVPSDLHR
jgi:hypothetical protein